MLNLLLSLLTGPLVNSVMGVINKHYDVQINKDKLQADVEKAILGTITDVTSNQADVLKAEINSEERLARIWRPIAALCLLSVLMFYSLILPIAVGWFGAPPVRVGDILLGWIYTLFGSCLGGYIVGRSLEKIVENVFKGRR